MFLSSLIFVWVINVASPLYDDNVQNLC